jgi:hypothetical protein
LPWRRRATAGSRSTPDYKSIGNIVSKSRRKAGKDGEKGGKGEKREKREKGKGGKGEKGKGGKGEKGKGENTASITTWIFSPRASTTSMKRKS